MNGAPINHVLDAGAGTVVVASFAGFLTPDMALIGLTLGVIWYGIEISESRRFAQLMEWAKRKWASITKRSPVN